VLQNPRASAARSAAGRPYKQIMVLRVRSFVEHIRQREACAQRVLTNGLRRSATLASVGRRIPIGTPIRDNDASRTSAAKPARIARRGHCDAIHRYERARSHSAPARMVRTLLPFAQHDFAHYDFKRGSFIHEHFHPQEEVYEVIEGELELTIGGVKQVTGPGLVGIVPSNVPHSVKALTDGRAIIVDYPLRTEMGERRS